MSLVLASVSSFFLDIKLVMLIVPIVLSLITYLLLKDNVSESEVIEKVNSLEMTVDKVDSMNNSMGEVVRRGDEIKSCISDSTEFS